MANSTATVTLDMTATIGGSSVTAARKTVAAPYQSVINGDLDIPVGATAGSSFAIPFGTIAKATAARVTNNTSADVILKSSAATVAALAPGGVFMIAGATATGTPGALTALTIEPTTTQAAAETINYWVFGDPT